MTESVAKFKENPYTCVLYFAVILALLFLAVYYLRLMAVPVATAAAKTEHIIGVGPANTFQSVVGGPDIRFGSQFSGTNQGGTPLYNKDLKEVYGVKKNENLTASREPPVYYDVAAQLDNYFLDNANSASATASELANASANAEHMSNSASQMAQDDMLRRVLYR